MRWRLRPGAFLALLATVGTLALLADGLAADRPTRALDQAIARGQRVAAPIVSLPTLTSRTTISLSALRGHVVVVNLWASWCEPCRAEAPLLERWYRHISPLGGTVVGIDTFDTTTDATAFIHQLKLTYPMLRDPGGEAKTAFGATGFPESVVIDRSGRVAALQRGPVDDSFMNATVLPLLHGRS